MSRLLTAAEVSDTLRVNVSTISRLVQRGELAAVRVGRRLLVAADDLEAFIARRRSEVAEPAGAGQAETTEVWSFDEFKAREMAELRRGRNARQTTKKARLAP